MLKLERRALRAIIAPVVLLSFFLADAHGQTPVIPESAARMVASSRSEVSPKPSVSMVTPTSSSLHIGVGDLLEVSVYGVPDLTQKVRVSGNGEIYLPLINYVHVADLAPDEAQALIEKKLSDGGFLRNPHVTILVSDSVTQTVTLLGEIAKPGTYPVIGERHLLDVISAAGGPTDKAGKAVTIVHRSHPEDPEIVDLSQGSAEGSPVNPPVTAGDTIIISKAGIVYVVGEVAKPSGFLMENGSLTVLKAIALAGGTTRTAALNNAKIIRKNAGGMEETPIPLKKILAAKSPDLPMQPEDVLFVPGSASKNAAVRGLEAVLQTATALSIVAVR
jgi:polysaccharide export outer membrane protein